MTSLSSTVATPSGDTQSTPEEFDSFSPEVAIHQSKRYSTLMKTHWCCAWPLLIECEGDGEQRGTSRICIERILGRCLSTSTTRFSSSFLFRLMTLLGLFLAVEIIKLGAPSFLHYSFMNWSCSLIFLYNWLFELYHHPVVRLIDQKILEYEIILLREKKRVLNHLLWVWDKSGGIKGQRTTWSLMVEFRSGTVQWTTLNSHFPLSQQELLVTFGLMNVLRGAFKSSGLWSADVPTVDGSFPQRMH